MSEVPLYWTARRLVTHQGANVCLADGVDVLYFALSSYNSVGIFVKRGELGGHAVPQVKLDSTAEVLFNVHEQRQETRLVRAVATP